MAVPLPRPDPSTAVEAREASARTPTGARAPAISPRRPARTTRHTVVLHTLPRFHLEVMGRAATPGIRAQRLLVLLAVRGSVSRSNAAGTLWPEATAQRAFASLRATLLTLSRLGEPVVTAAEALQLGEHVRVDLAEATRLARRVISRSLGATDAEVALGLLRHDLLPEWSEDWLHTEQFLFQQLRLHALQSLCRELSRTGDHAWAVEAGVLAVGCDPLRESAHHALMLAHLAEGNRYEAVRQYRLCAQNLFNELGLRPGEQLDALLEQALGGHAAVTPE